MTQESSLFEMCPVVLHQETLEKTIENNDGQVMPRAVFEQA